MTSPATASVSPRMTIEDTLHAILDAQLQIVGLLRDLPFSGRGSSLTIENLIKNPPKITTHQYEGQPLTHDDVDGFLDEHAYAFREAQRRSLDGWKETVAQLVVDHGLTAEQVLQTAAPDLEQAKYDVAKANAARQVAGEEELPDFDHIDPETIGDLELLAVEQGRTAKTGKRR